MEFNEEDLEGAMPFYGSWDLDFTGMTRVADGYTQPGREDPTMPTVTHREVVPTNGD